MGAPGRLASIHDDLLGALVEESTVVSDALHAQTVGALLAKAGSEGEVLLDTVRAFFRAKASVNAAADLAFIHRNTAIYRLNKVDKLTGLKVRELPDQLVWLLGLKVHDQS